MGQAQVILRGPDLYGTKVGFGFVDSIQDSLLIAQYWQRGQLHSYAGIESNFLLSLLLLDVNILGEEFPSGRVELWG